MSGSIELKKGSVDVNFYLSELLYSYKYGYKERYYRSLEKLKPYLDDRLYVFFYNFGFNSTFLKKV